MGDYTESQMFVLIREKHWPSIQYYLSTQCRERGYGLSQRSGKGLAPSRLW
jgi:hypothetical protein